MASNDDLAVRIDRSYQQAVSAAKQKIPYVLGGGHPGFGPSPGLPPLDNIIGLDCSGAASWILKAGGLLAIPPAKAALDVADFESWGEAGEGELTVWVRNDSVEQHCFLQFHGFENEFCEASHPGTFFRFLKYETFTDFKPRHWPGA